MAWAKVGPDLSKQDQTQTTYDPDKGTITKNRIQTWCAEYSGDARTVDPVSVEGATDGTNTIPVAGGIYTIGGLAGWRCIRTLPQRTGPSTFSVQVEYTRKTTSPPPGKDKWGISLVISGTKWTQTAYVDKDGNAIVNSAGESFEPTLTRTYVDEKIDVSYKTVTPPDVSTYWGRTNTSAVSFTISGITRNYAANSLLLDDGTINTTVYLDSDGSTPVWDVKLTFTGRTDTYRQWVLDQGYHQISGGPAKGGGVRKDTNAARSPGSSPSGLTHIYDQFLHQPVSTPHKLDGTGAPLAEGGTPIYWGFDLPLQTDLNPLFNGLS